MNQNLLIIGAGIYGLVAKEIAESMGCFRQIDFVDDGAKKTPDGTPVDNPRPCGAFPRLCQCGRSHRESGSPAKIDLLHRRRNIAAAGALDFAKGLCITICANWKGLHRGTHGRRPYRLRSGQGLPDLRRSGGQPRGYVRRLRSGGLQCRGSGKYRGAKRR